MLTHARLPLRFWDAAVLTACYLRNRLPILQNNNMTPIEIMNGHPPELSHLKVWGCICYAPIDTMDPQRYKLSPNSQKGIFVGYCESATQYQVYIPSKAGTNKVIISANVKFVEEIFWDWSELPNESLSQENYLLPGDPRSIDVIDSNCSSDDDLQGVENVLEGGVEDMLGNGVRQADLGQTPIENIEYTSTGLDEVENPEMLHPKGPDLRRSGRIRKPIEPRSAWQPRPHALHVEKNHIPVNF